MSIVKNYPASDSTYGNDTTMTVMRFEKDVPLASSPLPDKKPDGTAYTHPLVGFTAKYYLEVNNYIFGLGWYAKAGETVVIRAQVDPAAQGVIYGIYSGNNRRYVCAEEGYLRWYEGTTKVLERAIDGKMHEFGYIGYSDEGTLRSKPYYDNEFISVVGSTLSFTESRLALLQKYGDSYGLNAPGKTWAIRIYEVMASVYPTANATEQVVFDYYASTNASSLPWLMETRYDLMGSQGLSGSSIQGVTNHLTVGNFPDKGYGISLHDLKWFTGSGYSSLMAIVCSDGSLASDDADPADLIFDGESYHKMAFRMAGGQGTTVSDPEINMPETWQINRVAKASGAYMGNYEFGELIYGRSPGWPVWADGLKVGKYVRKRAINTGYRYEMVYNFRKNHRGKLFTGMKNGAWSDTGDDNPNNADRTELLFRFDGVGNEPEYKVHAPHFIINGAMNYEYHNRVMGRCSLEEVAFGCNNDGTSFVQPANRCAFFYHTPVSTFAGVQVGNLAPWDLTYNEIMQGEVASDAASWVAYGAAVDIEYDRYGAIMKLAKLIKYGTGTNNIRLFCKENTVDKAAFRDSMIVPDKPVLADRSSFDALYKFFSEKSWASLSAVCSLSLLSSQSGTPTEDQITHCDRMMPEQSIALNGVNDPDADTSSIQSYNTDRFIIGENGGVCSFGGQTCHIGVLAKNQSVQGQSEYDRQQAMTYEHMLVYNNNGTIVNHGYGIGCSIALYDDNNVLQKLVTHGSGQDPAETATLIVAYAEVTVVNPTNGKYVKVLHGFTKPESLRTPSNPNNGTTWHQPYYDRSISPTSFYPTPLFGLGDSFVPGGDSRQYNNRVWPIGTSVTPSTGADGDYFRTRSCLFRWKDLDTIGGSSYTNWQRPGINGDECPITVHMRVFEHNESAKRYAPFAWDLWQNTDHNALYWDENSGAAYVIGIGSNSNRLYFENTDRIMPVAYTNGSLAGTQILADGWFTVWNSNATTQQFTLPNMQIKVIETQLHDAHTEPTETEVATFNLSDSTKQATSGNYSIRIDGPLLYDNFSLLPDGSVTIGNQDGFYHLVLSVTGNVSGGSPFKHGAIYKLKIS